MLGTTQTRIPRRSFVICVIVAALAATIADATIGSPPVTLAQTVHPPENAVFYYQNIRRTDVKKFQGAYAVVTAGQQNAAGEKQAARIIQKSGAKALRYVNFYWYPEDHLYQGFNIGKHKNWIFCGENKRKLVGRKLNGEKWFFLDANERPARKAILDYLRRLKGYGYDGVFFDRGSSSFLGSKDGGKYISWKKSTCTKNKVVKRKRTFSDVFATLLRDARQKIFDRRSDSILVNYGRAPYTKPQIRPNPRDKGCRAREWRRCSSIGDVWKWVDQVIDEAVSHSGTKSFRQDYKENRTSERHYPDVLGEVKVAIKNDVAFKEQAYYQWAQARLFRINLFVNTGDDECPTSSGESRCWRYGTAPDLTKVSLGPPVDDEPSKMACDPGSKIKCLWVRRYVRGMVAVNTSPTNSKVLTKSLGVGKRTVKDVYNDLLLNGGLCMDEIGEHPVPLASGRVFVYEQPALCP